MTTQSTFLLPVLAFWPMLGALIAYCIGRKSKPARNRFAQSAMALELILLLNCALFLVGRGYRLVYSMPKLFGGLSFEADGFRILYSCIAGLMWFMTTLFSEEYLAHYRNRNRYYLFTLLTCGATVGVFLSADLITTFIFFEVMSFTSYVMVIHDENPSAMRAGQTYLAVAVLGGMVMLMGLFLLYTLTGTLVISALTDACAALTAEKRPTLYLAGALMLFGFGAKAGMYPLHIWLPKAHPVAPAPASALLSGILTKAGIFGVLVLSCSIFLHDRNWGIAILTLGVFTMFTGALIAVFSVNLKRTLACSSVSQIGFILVGIGMQSLLGEENALAVWGTELHMVNHSLIKLVLFMAAGAVYMNLHKLDLNDIRGFGRGKPLLTAIFLSGTLTITGVPLFSGYVSKTLLHESIVEYIELLEEAGRGIAALKGVEWIFLFSGGLTVAYMTKLFFCIFLEKNADPALQAKYDSLNGKYISLRSAFALSIPALILPVLGCFPSVFMQGIAEFGQSFLHGNAPAHAVHWFSLTNLKGAAISIAIGAAVYFGFIRTLLLKKDPAGTSRYVNLWPSRLDMEDAIYRPLCALLAFLALLFSHTASSLPDWIVAGLRKTVLRKIPIPPENPEDHAPADLAVDINIPKEMDDVLNDFSYGLILFGIGLVVVIVYLVFHAG
ncbi:MAG: sodium:proton antiporter [Oscillospiraceae bacterium]|nr:sodium:proton antiporter [Oscillospiraceae bacterium]